MAAPSSWRGYKCDLFFCIDSRTCGSGWVFGLESRYMHLHVSRIQSYHSATAIAAWMTYYVFGHVLFLACTCMCRIWLYVMCCVFPFSLHVLSVSLCRLSVLNLWAKRGHGLILVTATAFPCSQTNILFHHSLTAWLKKSNSIQDGQNTVCGNDRLGDVILWSVLQSLKRAMLMSSMLWN